MNTKWVLIGVAVVIVIAGITVLVKAMRTSGKIYMEGVEADSVVVRTEPSGKGRCSSYVEYVGDDGAKHESLLNVDLPVGRKVRIKYIPGKFDEVVFISQELEENEEK